MDWQESAGCWLWIPSQPRAVIHFLGGAFVGTAPNLAYRWLLTELGQRGYAIIATPFSNSLDHQALARQALNRFDTAYDRLRQQNRLPQGYLPIYGLGHSLGSKIQLLIGSSYPVERAGNILISFNNFPVKRAIPFLEQAEQLKLDGLWEAVRGQLPEQLGFGADLSLEFTPSPEDTNKLIRQNYQVRRNLLIKFTQDDIDQTLTLPPLFNESLKSLLALQTLPGTHLTPLAQDLQWAPGEVFTPWDAVGQWLKSNLSQDLYRLRGEILRWLNPLEIQN